MDALMVAVVAGALTTLVGMGGGALLVLFLVATGMDPIQALGATSVGLLVGNLHRVALYRDDLDRRAATALILGGFPAAALTAWLATGFSPAVLKGGIACMALVGVLFAATGRKLRVPPAGFGVAGAVVGVVSATTGAAGLVAGPFLLAAGLSGRRYVATAAAMAVSIHLGRLLGYGSGAPVERSTLLLGVAFAIAVPLGNLVGHRVRSWLPTGAMRPLELGTAATMASLALVGLR